MFSFQWLILRLSALTLFLGCLVDIEIILITFGFVILHISLGLRTIVYDYIHIRKIKFVSSTLVRISLIEITRYALELLI